MKQEQYKPTSFWRDNRAESKYIHTKRTPIHLHYIL